MAPRPHGTGWRGKGHDIAVAAAMVLGTAALYYSTIRPDALRLGLCTFFPAIMMGSAWLRPPALRHAVRGATVAALAGWYVTDPPRNDRVWAEEYAIPADTWREGNMVHVRNVRNFRYRSVTDYLPAWYDATYDLSRLDRVDLVTSYWAGENIAHVFLSFGFSDGQHLAISIETRRQARFAYSTIAGFFHHYELFYVTADERDLIGVRTDVRRERIYLYRLDLSPAVRARLFLSYVDAIHDIIRHPLWYNTLGDNCTTGILARAGAKLRYRLDWRVILSGHTASMAYDMNLLGPYDPKHYPDFTALHAASRIQRPAGAVIGPDYSTAIRAALPPPEGPGLP
ncbi:Lnb N-terminal periplasmic domain-containing protein [Komagataeibacter melomenusus]